MYSWNTLESELLLRAFSSQNYCCVYICSKSSRLHIVNEYSILKLRYKCGGANGQQLLSYRLASGDIIPSIAILFIVVNNSLGCYQKIQFN